MRVFCYTVQASGEGEAMRVWFKLKKVIAGLAILFIMYMFIGFFWWHYVVNPTMKTEGSQQIMEAVNPATVFFKPSVDFYTWAYNCYLGAVNPGASMASSHSIEEASGVVESFEGGGGTYSNSYFGIRFACDPPWTVMSNEQLRAIGEGNGFAGGVEDMRVDLGYEYGTARLSVTKASYADFQRYTEAVKKEKEGYGYSVEMVDAPWTVGENQFQGVRMHVIDEYGVWSAEYYGYCSKEGISMFVEIYNVPDDGAIDAVLNCFQPLESAG